ncbi:MAG: hypothetical protein WC483_00215 [Candidatus Paceibacterota bacterium]
MATTKMERLFFPDERNDLYDTRFLRIRRPIPFSKDAFDKYYDRLMRPVAAGGEAMTPSPSFHEMDVFFDCQLGFLMEELDAGRRLRLTQIATTGRRKMWRAVQHLIEKGVLTGWPDEALRAALASKRYDAVAFILKTRCDDATAAIIDSLLPIAHRLIRFFEDVDTTLFFRFAGPADEGDCAEEFIASLDYGHVDEMCIYAAEYCPALTFASLLHRVERVMPSPTKAMAITLIKASTKRYWREGGERITEREAKIMSLICEMNDLSGEMPVVRAAMEHGLFLHSLFDPDDSLPYDLSLFCAAMQSPGMEALTRLIEERSLPCDTTIKQALPYIASKMLAKADGDVYVALTTMTPASAARSAVMTLLADKVRLLATTIFPSLRRTSIFLDAMLGRVYRPCSDDPIIRRYIALCVVFFDDDVALEKVIAEGCRCDGLVAFAIRLHCSEKCARTLIAHGITRSYDEEEVRTEYLSYFMLSSANIERSRLFIKQAS